MPKCTAPGCEAAKYSLNELDRVGYFLDALQEALPMASGWYCHTNRADMGLVIQQGVDGPSVTLYGDGTWEAKGIEGVSGRGR